MKIILFLCCVIAFTAGQFSTQNSDYNNVCLIKNPISLSNCYINYFQIDFSTDANINPTFDVTIFDNDTLVYQSFNISSDIFVDFPVNTWTSHNYSLIICLIDHHQCNSYVYYEYYTICPIDQYFMLLYVLMPIIFVAIIFFCKFLMPKFIIKSIQIFIYCKNLKDKWTDLIGNIYGTFL